MKGYGVMLLIFACIFSVKGQNNIKVDVNLDSVCKTLSPTMWGVFFEDINFAVDGGLNPELVKNGSFEFPDSYMGWQFGKPCESKIKYSKNANYLSISNNSLNNTVILENEGYRGIGVRKDASYQFSISAKTKGRSRLKCKVQLIAQGGDVIAEKRIFVCGYKWKKQNTYLKSKQTCLNAKLRLIFEGNGNFCLDNVSLTPNDVYKIGNSIFRKDLVETIADLQPGFFRFPGGCVVEGYSLQERYQWKQTVGPKSERSNMISRWNRGFGERLTPDYYQTFAIGFYEYFLLSEELKSEPVPIINCGMSCQFNTAELIALERMGPFVQDALDLIEFANGKVDTYWGRIRSELGHPKPFNLKYIGIGNEQWGPDYIPRFNRIAKAIKNKYPEIKIISGSGPWADGKEFHYLWNAFEHSNYSDLVDEHYYKPPEWFLSNTERYDSYNRHGQKVFVGEFAAHTLTLKDSLKRNTWEAALSEAAYMTGLERNCDIVEMAAYAPLLGHVKAWQWSPNLIWFDNLNVLRTANYYIHKLFSLNSGTHVIPVSLKEGEELDRSKIFVSACVDSVTNNINVKLVNTSNQNKNLSVSILTKEKMRKKVIATVLSGSEASVYNSFREPERIVPYNIELEQNSNTIDLNLDSKSLTVLNFKCK